MGIRALVLFLLPILAFADDNVLDKAASDAVNSFSVDFLKEVLKKTEGNVAMSPVSVSTLLAILHQGADGNTKTQLTEALQSEPEQTLGAYKKITHSLKNVSNGTLLEFANGMFLNKGYKVLPKFKQHVEEDFLSEIAISNFAENVQSAEQINKWVSEHTHDKIKELVKPEMLDNFTRMVLVNAIYFKDIWKKPFRAENTRTETFYTDSEKQVPMMHTRDSFKTGHFDDIQAQWLEMPFQGGRFSMIMVLPKEKNGLQNTLTQMTSEHISKLLNNAKQGHAERVILTMPKFEIASTLKLIPILKASVLRFNKELISSTAGAAAATKLSRKKFKYPKMPDLFSDYANLSGVSEEHIGIDKAIQKAVMKVDELGATAAASTAVIGVVPVSAIVNLKPDVVFNADHPFLVFIMDNINRVILFAGKVLDPSLA